MLANIPGYFDKLGRFHLTKPLTTRFGIVVLPFDTDGFTIPWFLRWFHNPFGVGLVAAIWHDFALKKQSKRAHIQFYWLLRLYKISKRKAKIMYIVVVNYAKAKRLIKKISNLLNVYIY
ncbi:MAG: DUF1353 domain-containing protein [Alcanivoracaceae bacterium]|nr:DUF1353 domain-containing protein [Alcanivoracaceae bacterium]